MTCDRRRGVQSFATATAVWLRAARVGQPTIATSELCGSSLVQAPGQMRLRAAETKTTFVICPSGTPELALLCEGRGELTSLFCGCVAPVQ